MKRQYAILDVFTDTPLSGNALAVVRDGDGLDTTRMQAIAREFNLSETVFILPAENPLHSARVRIFTPGSELPFAGHPTVGTAVLIAADRAAAGSGGEKDAMVILEEGVGPVRCGVTIDSGIGFARVDVPRLPVEKPLPASVEAIAAALRLPAEAIGFEHHQPTAFDAGMQFCYVPIRNAAALAEAKPVAEAWAAAFGSGLGSSAWCYTRETVGVGRQFHARMFAPTLGIAEDPATGAAVAAFAGVIGRFEPLAVGPHRYIVEQGFEMGRPSLISLEIEYGIDGIETVRIGGQAVVIGEGWLDL